MTSGGLGRYVLEVLELPEAGFGWLVAIYAAGGVVGAVVAGWLAHQTDLRTPYVALGILQLLATLAFAPVIHRELGRDALVCAASRATTVARSVRPLPGRLWMTGVGSGDPAGAVRGIGGQGGGGGEASVREGLLDGGQHGVGVRGPYQGDDAAAEIGRASCRERVWIPV